MNVTSARTLESTLPFGEPTAGSTKSLKIADAAGIDVNLTTHVARNTSAQRMMEQGWSLQEIQTALAHESISTTEHYLRTVRDEELDDKHEDLW